MAIASDAPPIPQLQCETDTGIDTVPLALESSFDSWQQEIPHEYWELEPDELVARVRAARAQLGDRAVVLGHHYQRQDIIQFADERGDSFMLAQYAAERPQAEYIVFLRRALHGGGRRHPLGGPPAGDPAEHRGRLLHVGHGGERRRAGGRGRSWAITSAARTRSSPSPT